jgi:tRNA modification GTPase
MTPLRDATVVVELTPYGRGAVAVVAVAGPNALRTVDNCFVARSGRALGDIPFGRIVLGHWGGANGEELVLFRHDQNEIEVHCHGGIAAAEAVVTRLVNEGCHRLTWQEWINRCTPDRTQAAARIALADAVTERTAAILLDQLNGALSGAVRGVIADVAAAEWSSVAGKIDELLSRQQLGLHLTSPWRVVVFGAPNVGKSSLINALAGYERAIVSPTPGTTRDVVTVTTAIEGWPVQLSDTAGFRATQDELESAGIKLATTALSGAELAIFVHDAAKLNDAPSKDERIIEPSKLAPHVPAIHIVNKIDLLSPAQRLGLLQQFVDSVPGTGHPYAVSALNGEGIADMISAIAHRLVPISPPAESAVPFTSEQIGGLVAAAMFVEQRNAAAASDVLHALLTQTG